MTMNKPSKIKDALPMTKNDSAMVKDAPSMIVDLTPVSKLLGHSCPVLFDTGWMWFGMPVCLSPDCHMSDICL